MKEAIGSKEDTIPTKESLLRVENWNITLGVQTCN
jgi:hypothetical protein